MIFKEYKNEEDFLKENEYELLLAQDINNTMLGIIPQVEKEKIFFRIENDDKIELIGIITKTERKGLIIYIKDSKTSIDVCEFLVNEIISRDIDLKEIKAPKGIADIIFDVYSKNRNITAQKHKICYLMRLNNLNKVTKQDGIIRQATMEDLEFEKGMVLEIFNETLEQECSEKRAYEIAEIYIKKGLYFLVNEYGEILSQASTTQVFKNGYTIGAVYTPKDKRRKGYARECLYKVIQKIRDENKEIIVLYSNVKRLENRKLYESLGFEIILEETVINF